MIFKRKKKKEEENSVNVYKKELMEELEAAQSAMATAHTNFSYVIEPELIDSCIYEINALSLRYKFILSQVKSLEKRGC